MTFISHIAVLVDFTSDQSYTPIAFDLLGGTDRCHVVALCEKQTQIVQNVDGWNVFPLTGGLFFCGCVKLVVRFLFLQLYS
jgi:hypothetical protein